MEDGDAGSSGKPVGEKNVVRGEATSRRCHSGWTPASPPLFGEGMGTGTRMEYTSHVSSCTGSTHSENPAVTLSSAIPIGGGMGITRQTSQNTTAPGSALATSSSSRGIAGSMWSRRRTTSSSFRCFPQLQLGTETGKGNGAKGCQTRGPPLNDVDEGLARCGYSMHARAQSVRWVANDARGLNPHLRVGDETKGSDHRHCMLLTRRRDELPITSSDALEHCGNHFSAYEQEEILNFHNIYYCGGHTRGASLAAQVTGSLQHCYPPLFCDKKNNYRVVCGDHVAYRYELIDVIGRGTYGCVVRALDHAVHPTPHQCALKIAKNIPCYAAALMREADMLKFLRRSKQQAGVWVPQVLACFTFRGHEFIALPLYGLDLKTLLRVNLFRPLPLALTCAMTAQMVVALKTLSALGVTHADLKPENIALVDRSPGDKVLPSDIISQMRHEDSGRQGGVGASRTKKCTYGASDSTSVSIGCTDTENEIFSSNLEEEKEEAGSPEDEHDDATVTSHIAVIDFGGAHVGTSCAHPVQTVSYRAPEAVLHLSYGPAIDMWSLGCVVYEISTGVPLFQADADKELLQCHVAVLGAPSPETLRALQSLSDVFGDTGGDGGANHGNAFFKTLRGSTEDEYHSTHGRNLLQLLHINLGRKTMTVSGEGGGQQQQYQSQKDDTDQWNQLLLLDFLLGCLTWDPAERLTPDEASCHPYLAPYFRGEPLGVQERIPLSMRCSGMHYLQTHPLTRRTAAVLEAVEKECARRASAEDAALVSLRLDVRRAIRPLCEFTGEQHDGTHETPLRISAASHPPLRKSAGDECSSPNCYTATFLDPFERVEVSIMKFEDY